MKPSANACASAIEETPAKRISLTSRSVWLARWTRPLGLWGRGVDELDAQALDHAAELGEAVAALRLLGVDAENAVPIISTLLKGDISTLLQHAKT